METQLQYQTQLKSGSQLLVECLHLNGVKKVFAYIGNYVLDIFDALSHSDIEVVSATSEQNAVRAAIGYAIASDSVGVVLTTSGPGATNLVTGIACAWADSIPLLAITGNVPLSKLGTDSFQEVDISGITMPITKYNYMIKNTDLIPSVVAEALGIVNGGRKGPVLIDIPVDIAEQKSTATAIKAKKIQPPCPSAQKLQQAAELINNASKPLIIAGGGAAAARAEIVFSDLAKRLNAPVAATLTGLCAVNGNDYNYLGMTGKYGAEAVQFAQKKCDCVIAVGCRFSDRQTELLKYKNLIHIDIDDAEIDKRLASAVGIKADANQALTLLLPLIKQKNGDFLELIKQHTAKQPISHNHKAAQKYFEVISSNLPQNAIVATDVGRHQLLAANLLRLAPHSFLTSGGMGEMGFGLGAAIGANIASGRPVFLITGDGSIMMSFPEIANAVRLGVKLTVIILNDKALGLVKQWQEERYGKAFETDYTMPIDFKAAAEAMGAKGFTVKTPKALDSALKKAKNLQCSVIDLRLKKELTVKAMF